MKNTNLAGRLKESLHPVAHAIAFPMQEKHILLNELTMLALLNEAHLVSLSKAKLIPLSAAKKLLKAIGKLRKTNFSKLFELRAERGSYLLFENYLIDLLGMKIAGSLHIGRSRNDINATIFKLSIRDYYKTICSNLCLLRSTLLKQATQYQQVVMPVYSQFQVAQVGTYAYYLLGIEEALARDQAFLKELAYFLDECPLGAAAGCGTSFAIDRELTASLLGFKHCCKNALDAVANRDLALRMLTAVSVLGTTLSRIAQDYQIWTTQEFSFFELPDNLCGGSSMMPQKKNPYLFEIIKGKSVSANGYLVQTLTAMHNVPFSNSVEVGQAVRGIDTAFSNIADIIKLADLLIAGAIPIEDQFINSINKGMAMAANIAELCVQKKGIPFRQAHHEIGASITRAMDQKLDVISELREFADERLADREALFWAHLNEHGGGPGKHATRKALKQAEKRLIADTAWLVSVENQWTTAEQELQRHSKKIIGSKVKSS